MQKSQQEMDSWIKLKAKCYFFGKNSKIGKAQLFGMRNFKMEKRQLPI